MEISEEMTIQFMQWVKDVSVELNINDVNNKELNERAKYWFNIFMNREVSGGALPVPFLVSLDKTLLNQSKTYDITVNGSFFTPDDLSVRSEALTINSITFINDNTISVNVSTPDYNLEGKLFVSNSSGESLNSLDFKVELSTWIDLRQGGNSFNEGDIRMRNGMTLFRDEIGMGFLGSNPWSSWVKFEVDKWNRGENKTFEIIMNSPSGGMMLGIGSDKTNETSTAQYSQAETMAYFNGTTAFWGLYGNNGNIGSAGSDNYSGQLTINTNSIFKLKFEGDGSRGSIFSIYQLENSLESNWDDESNLLFTTEISGTLNPDEQVIMPFIIPRIGSQRIISYKVK